MCLFVEYSNLNINLKHNFNLWFRYINMSFSWYTFIFSSLSWCKFDFFYFLLFSTRDLINVVFLYYGIKKRLIKIKKVINAFIS